MLGTPKANPAFISILLIDVLNFASLATAGPLLRGDRSAHKRLMLLATMSLLQAGFVRWWGPAMTAAFGTEFQHAINQLPHRSSNINGTADL